MATPSDSPPSLSDNNTSPVSQAVGASYDGRPDTKVEAVTESSRSVFVNSEPIQEEQVQNAMKFLSHPKVRGSPVIYRRSFLERKGLTKEEVDEAFRRVPKSVVPRLKSWIRKVVLEEDDEDQMEKNNAKPSAAEEAAAAAKAAAVAAADVARASQEMLITKREEKICFEELINMLNAQVHEMKSISNSIQKLESGQSVNGRIALEEPDNPRFSGFSSRQPYINGKTDIDSRKVRSSSPPASVEPSAAPHPKSYTDKFNDAPPNPNQPLSNLRGPWRTKPWENIQAQSISANFFPFQESSNGPNFDYQDSQLNGDDAVPLWQRKNVRITEIETGEEQKFVSSKLPGNERPAQRAWVPPQPPPVVIPEAATAIRQQKKASTQTESMSDDQLFARSGDATDEWE